MNIAVGKEFRFQDHHCYNKKEFKEIEMTLKKNNIDTIITTEKDAAKISAFAGDLHGLSIVVLRIAITFKADGQEFYNRLLKLYSV
jgi:tetraacyldisaccharide-1-P 4'-kinase